MLNILSRSYFDGESGGNGDQTPPPKTFTQDEVNKLLADNKKSLRDELDKLKKAGDPTALQTKITELSNTLATKEELARQEAEEAARKYTADLEAATGNAKAWEARFKAGAYSTEVAKAAAKYDAFDADQLSLILRDQTNVVEVTDKEGKGTGEFAVKTTLTIDGKKLELTLDEAVGKLREDKRFANQFKVKGSPGTGITLNNGGGGAAADGQPPMNPTDFIKWNQARKGR